VFQPGSDVSIKQLKAFSQWFNGAWLGEIGNLSVGYFNSAGSVNEARPEAITISGLFGSITLDDSVAYVNPVESSEMQLLYPE
jgi:hypothetical protein